MKFNFIKYFSPLLPSKVWSNEHVTKSASPLHRTKHLKAARSASAIANKTKKDASASVISPSNSKTQSTSLTCLKLPVATESDPNNVIMYNNQAFTSNTTSNNVVEDDVVASIILDDPNAFDRCCFDQNLFENLIQTPVKQQKTSASSTPLKSNSLMLNFNGGGSSTVDNISMIINNKIRTPTPLKNAMNKIKLKEAAREKLRVKSLALNSQFCDSGYSSFNENNTQLIENLNAMPLQMPPMVSIGLSKSGCLNLNVNNPILIGKTNDQLSLTEKARTLINNNSGGQFSFTFSCTSTPLLSHININSNTIKTEKDF
jgi:hypothetical protein